MGFGFQWNARLVGVIQVIDGKGLPINEHSSSASVPNSYRSGGVVLTSCVALQLRPRRVISILLCFLFA